MNPSRLLLNLGCGRSFHRDWRNLDLVPQSEEVEAVDLSKGIPCESNTADAVYHSHMLEHLALNSAKDFVNECFRVLKPGGVIRIAVPDLEQIARHYLESLNVAWHDPNRIHLANHYWMQLELLDQVVRNHSGGEMGRYMADPTVPNADFVRSRLGNEVSLAQRQKSANDEEFGNQESTTSSKENVPLRPGFWARIKSKIKRKILKWLLGKGYEQQLAAIEFRKSGEIHQWMYDRVSLRTLLQEIGFVEFQVCDSVTSKIEGFANFELDSLGNQTRKPDSIFVEAIKPAREEKAAA